MDKIIISDINKCSACNKCIECCPIEFANYVKVENNERKVYIDSSRCINCGKCITVCYNNTRTYQDDLTQFLEDVKTQKDIIFLVTPDSLAEKFENYKKVLGYLHSLGIKHIYDASFGVNITSWATINFLKEHNDKFYITHTCGNAIDLIQKYYKNLISHLVPTNGPNSCSAIYLRKYKNEKDSKIALLSHCISSGEHFKEENNINYNITVAKLYNYIKENKIDIEQYDEYDFDEIDDKNAKYFNNTKDLSEYVAEYFPDYKIKNIDDKAYIFDYIKLLSKNFESKSKYNIYNIISCKGYCNNLHVKQHDFNDFTKIPKGEIIPKANENNEQNVSLQKMMDYFDETLKLEDFLITVKDKTKDFENQLPPSEDIEKAFEKMGKHIKTSKSINCSNCGYKTCTDLAIAICKEKNVPQSCFRYNFEAINDKNKYIETIIENISDAVFVTNSKKRIEYVNKMGTEILGYDHSMYIGKPFQDFLVRFNLKPLKVVPNQEYLALHRNGKNIIININCSKCTIDNEEKYILIVRDISKEKELEVVKNNFISIVSHELRTPLTSIKGAIGLLSSGMLCDIPDNAKNLLNIATSNITRLNSIINDMLDIEKIKAGKMDFQFKEYDVQTLVDDAIRANENYAAENNVKIKTGNKIFDVKINVDNGRFNQILTNLLSNAAKHATSNTDIIVDAETIGNNARISVTNQGEGIPEDIGKKVFDSFYQVANQINKKKKGTGLGLNLCKFLTEHMDGQINYHSTIGETTTFYVDFPIAKPLEESKNVLILEDNETVSAVLAQALKELDYNITIAKTIKEAEQKLFEEDNKFSICSFDIILPDGNGLDLLDKVKNTAKYKNIPVLIVSVKKENKEIISKYKNVVWIEKTLNKMELQEILQATAIEKNKGKLKILYAEDDYELTALVKSMLQEEAIVDISASNANAMEKLKTTKYDIIILDYTLSDGTCEQLFNATKNFQPNAKIILFTGSDFPESLKSEISNILLKTDVSITNFVDKIKKVKET